MCNLETCKIDKFLLLYHLTLHIVLRDTIILLNINLRNKYVKNRMDKD